MHVDFERLKGRRLTRYTVQLWGGGNQKVLPMDFPTMKKALSYLEANYSSDDFDRAVIYKVSRVGRFEAMEG